MSLLPQTQAPSRAVCAANLADKYSIAGAVGTIGKTGFAANVFNGFAGNTFSGRTLAFSGGGNKYRIGSDDQPLELFFNWFRDGGIRREYFPSCRPDRSADSHRVSSDRRHSNWYLYLH